MVDKFILKYLSTKLINITNKYKKVKREIHFMIIRRHSVSRCSYFKIKFLFNMTIQDKMGITFAKKHNFTRLIICKGTFLGRTRDMQVISFSVFKS